jgi:hypothetical protein
MPLVTLGMRQGSRYLLDRGSTSHSDELVTCHRTMLHQQLDDLGAASPDRKEQG